jgi:signal transduction histidine kinase
MNTGMSESKTWQILPLVGGFSLLFVMAGLVVWLSALQQDSSKWVGRSLSLESALNQLQTTLTDAETGQRGYLLTGHDDYLKPYQRAKEQLPAAIDRVERIAGPASKQFARLQQLRHLSDAKFAELQSTIDKRQNGQLTEALAILNNDSGAELMAEMRLVLEDARDEESRLFMDRTARADRLSTYARLCLILCLLIAAVLAVGTVRDSWGKLDRLRSVNERLVVEMAERQAAEVQVRQLQKMEAIGQLTGGIAHDFNNMLAIIIGSLDIARRRLSGAEHPQILTCLDNAREGAQRAVLLTTRLLAFSRQQPLEPTSLDANKLVGGMSELLRRTIGEPIAIETVLAGGLWRTYADGSQLENALLNLAVNARDAMPDGGKLTIETSNAHLDEQYARQHSEVPVGQYVLISVSDTGVGMAPEVVQRAFDPFYTTKGVGKGTGLGLSQVFGYVKQSGGHVKIYSEIGRGTTVKVYLPRHTGEDKNTQQSPQPVNIPRGDRAEIILVVEDDMQVRHMSVDALRELNYTIVQAGTPSEALKQLELQPHITLMFTDVVMPEMSGRQLATLARERRPKLKVLYTTGYTRNAVVHNGVLDSGTHLLVKPFTLEQLARKIREVIENGEL